MGFEPAPELSPAEYAKQARFGIFDREADVEQLAMFAQAKDAREYGMTGEDGVAHPLWSELDDDMGRAEYRREASLFLACVELLGYTKAGR